VSSPPTTSITAAGPQRLDLPADQRPRRRLAQVDALRGLAAVAVMAFHYTTRYDELYGFGRPLPVYVPWGYLGVNLFFVISGFVIFMTLERTRTSLDFVVSRFSRLFPAYWTAVAVTFVVTAAFGLPGKVVGVRDAVLNLLMIHGLFHVPHLDGVYWTLEVELLFYAFMLALYRLSLLTRIHLVLVVWLAVRWVYFVVDAKLGINLPFIVYRLGIVAYIPFFAIGIAVYLAVRGNHPRRNAGIIALALVTLTVTESAMLGFVGGLCAASLWLAATGRLRLLRNPLFVWLGMISYTLYLLHENIGWCVIMLLERVGAPTMLAIAAALAVVLAAASALTFAVERPAMRAIRQRYKTRRALAVPALQAPPESS